MTINIRPACLEDAPALAALLHEMGQFTRINAQTIDETTQAVRRQMALCLADSSHSIFVAETAPGQIAGYVAIHWLPYLIHTGPEGYVSELFISPAARGQGIGSALLDLAVRQGRERGCSRMALLNMRERESYQRGFYKKQGWEEREDAANFILQL